MFKTLLSATFCLTAAPALAVPPPVPTAPVRATLKPDNCPVAFAATAGMYDPARLAFAGKAGDELLMIFARPDPALTFNLTIDGGQFITDAAFGPDTRIRLPRAGNYELQVSGWDQVARAPKAISFALTLHLSDEERAGDCEV